MDFLIGIIMGIAIGFFWGIWRATQSFIERIVNEPEEIRELMNRVNKSVKEETDKLKESTEQDYRTEWHDGQCYLYDSKDNFLAQGETIIEAMDRAEKRFPGLKLNFRLNTSDKSNQ
jgi:MFS superfamily sulfate permease-like transporter